MSLFNMFKPAETPAPAADVSGNPVEIPAAPLEGLDKWGNLVQDEGNSGKPDADPPTVFDPVAILKDPEALENIANSIDFSSAITETTQQKLADQSPDALINLVQDISKAAYLRAIQDSSALSQQHISDRLAQQTIQTKDEIATGLSAHELEKALPEIKNPIIRIGIEGFIGKLREQTPGISGMDIASEVKGYLAEMSKAVNPNDSTDKANTKSKEVDWLSEMGF